MRKAFVILVILAAFAVAGCSTERYGSAIEGSAPQIKIKDILLDTSVLGKSVTVKGYISSQCGSNGCWFVLRDDTGQIFVNLKPANMTLPPRLGREAAVTGVVYPVQGEIQLIAQGVELG